MFKWNKRALYLSEPLNSSINRYFLVPVLPGSRTFKKSSKSNWNQTLKMEFLVPEPESEP